MIKLSYDELEDIIQRYQQGDPAASQEVLDAFRSFLRKYHRLICFGQFDIHDRGTRSFISLFMNEHGKRAKIHQFKYAPSARYDMYKTVQMIREFFQEHSPEDIEQELVLALLLMAQRYRNNDDTPGFHKYMSRAFHFQIFRQLKGRSIRAHMSLDESTTEGDDYIDVDKLVNDHAYITVEDQLEDQIDENWINGFTCSDLFQQLNSVERRILRWYYVDGKSDKEIAKKLGLHRVNVTIRRAKIKDKIAREYYKQGNKV